MKRYRTDIGPVPYPVGVEFRRKSHQTTIRFTAELWAELEDAAAGLDVSVAQYVRDAARARLDEGPAVRQSAAEPAIAAPGRSF
jgi:hypothetical protein